MPRGDLSSGLCDVWIGRYCYWRGDEEEDADPPAEPESIRQRRASLLRLLDSVATVLPGDPWIGGQLVRYLAEAGRFDDAIAFAERCTAARSWCLALAGYAAHVGDRFTLADSLFSASLAALPTEERCRWLDISELIDGDLADAFKRVDCDHRDEFVRRVLRIGAPLYSVSTSDLFTEYLARVTRTRIVEHTASPDGMTWGDDQRELLVRYGWPRWYTRWDPSSTAWMESLVFGHEGGMPFDFMPSLHATQHLSEIADGDWHLDDERAVTGYAPTYAKTVHDGLPSQLVRFRRGDSTLIIGAWDARRDTTMRGRTINAALAVLGDSTVTVARTDSVRTRGHISVTARVDSGVISLELFAPKERRAARTRQGVGPRALTRVSLSDLLLYAPGDSTPMTVAAAADSALASAEVSGGRALGVFWETYGLREPGEHVHYTLTVEQVDVGWMRRVAAHVHLTDPSRELRIQWDAQPMARSGIAGQGVKIDVSQLRHGRYRLELAAEADGGAAVRTSRVIEVR